MAAGTEGANGSAPLPGYANEAAFPAAWQRELIGWVWGGDPEGCV